MVVSQNIEWTIVWPVTNMRARKSTFTNIHARIAIEMSTNKTERLWASETIIIYTPYSWRKWHSRCLSLFGQHYEWKPYFFSHLFRKMFQKKTIAQIHCVNVHKPKFRWVFPKIWTKILHSACLYPCVCEWFPLWSVYFCGFAIILRFLSHWTLDIWYRVSPT